MRVLAVCIPQAGHWTPPLALEQAFAAQGDDVVVASGADFEPVAQAHGLRFECAGPTFGEWYERLRARTRGVPGDGLPPAHVERYFLPRLFGEVGLPAMVDDLLAIARDLRPDLVMFDPLALAAPLVAAVLGARTVHHTVGPLIAPEVWGLVTDAVSPVWREFGLDVPPSAGVYQGTTVTICPPSLDSAGAALAQRMPLRPAALPLAEPPPLHVAFDDPTRPLVYLTLGTFSNTNLAVFRTLIAAASRLPVNVLVTIGRDNTPAALGDVPGNVHVAQFIPQAEVLPHCAAAVHHAGSGTMFGILAHGLPSVAVPQSADNFSNGERLATAGAAQTLMPGEVSEQSVADALRAVLDDPRFARRAAAIKEEMAAMPSAAEVAAALRTPAAVPEISPPPRG